MKNKKPSHKLPKKGFDKKKKDFKPAKDALISNVSLKIKGDRVSLTGEIDRVTQTSGPTLFFLNDGTGTLLMKGFDGPGVRAHPQVKETDCVKVIVKVNEFNGSLEGEIAKIVKLTESEVKNFKQKLKDIERERAKVTPPEFLIKSPILDKLKESFIKAATEIKLAIIQNRPIIVRHHNDTDGYSSGFALERAIVPLIEEQHGPGSSKWEYYTRAPCAAPFYEIDDSIRDTSNSLFRAARFSNKMPLVIIADNGSSQQDLMGIKQGKIHGMDFIVIDHHFFEKDVISKEVLVHINPFLVGEDGSHFSAGMLCVEFARFVKNDVENIDQIAAMAGLADRIKNEKAIKDYLAIAKSQGYSKELLGKIAQVIDFVSAKLRFMEAREYIEVLFGEPMEQQKSLVELMSPYISELEKKGLEIAKSAAKLEKLGKVTLQTLDIDETFPGFGFYPKPGMAVGLAHDNAQTSKKLKALVSAGIMRSAMTIRATDDADFSVHDLIDLLHKKLPEAFVAGGGHKNAGSITFIPSKKEEVIKLFKKFVKK